MRVSAISGDTVSMTSSSAATFKVGEVINQATTSAAGVVTGASAPTLVAHPTGDQPPALIYDGANIGWTSGSATEIYQFKVTFDANGRPTATSDFPSGWSATIASDTVTVTHTAGSVPKCIHYLGYDTQNAQYRLRHPTGAYGVNIPSVNLTTKFSFNIISSIAGSDYSGYAYIHVVF